MIKKLLKPKSIFFIICTFGILSYAIFAYRNGERALYWLLQENTANIRAVDYFLHIMNAMHKENLYANVWGADSAWGCFPPLNYVMYYFLYSLSFNRLNPTIGSDELFKVEKFELIYSLFLIFMAFIVYYGIERLSKKNNSSKILFWFILLSPIFIGSGFLTGNSTILVSGLLLLFFSFKDSENKYHRELALIILAICAGLKLYPAIFGLLYLKEKRWQEALRLTIYGLLFIFVPFVFFGGFKGLTLWLNHIINTMSLQIDGRIQYIKGLTYYILVHFFNNPSNSSIVTNLTSILPIIFLLLMIILAIFDKKRDIFFLTYTMILFPTNSHRYTLSYLIIPLVIWFYNKENNSIEDYIKAICYSSIFSIPVLFGYLTSFNYGIENYYTLTYVEIYLYSFTYLFLIIEIGLSIKDIIKSRHS